MCLHQALPTSFIQRNSSLQHLMQLHQAFSNIVNRQQISSHSLAPSPSSNGILYRS